MSLTTLGSCTRCTRLVAHLDAIRILHPTYQNAPIANWGPRQPKLLIVGLAPGLHGANQTGKGFVGDASGKFLFAALFAEGFASSPIPAAARLIQCNITNAVKCLPPGNSVNAQELANCSEFLRADLNLVDKPSARTQRAVLALGGIAWNACVKQLIPSAPRANAAATKFRHGNRIRINPQLELFSSYHPSRQNVNTKRLNQNMLRTVLRDVRRFIMPT